MCVCCRGAAQISHYAASKGAIISFTRSVALEVGQRNINVETSWCHTEPLVACVLQINCVAPGSTRTEMTASIDEEILEVIKAGIPKGRLATVEDVAPTYLFLASEDSKHYVGQCLSPNGGDVFL